MHRHRHSHCRQVAVMSRNLAQVRTNPACRGCCRRTRPRRSLGTARLGTGPTRRLCQVSICFDWANTGNRWPAHMRRWCMDCRRRRSSRHRASTRLGCKSRRACIWTHPRKALLQRRIGKRPWPRRSCLGCRGWRRRRPWLGRLCTRHWRRCLQSYRTFRPGMARLWAQTGKCRCSGCRHRSCTDWHRRNSLNFPECRRLGCIARGPRTTGPSRRVQGSADGCNRLQANRYRWCTRCRRHSPTARQPPDNCRHCTHRPPYTRCCHCRAQRYCCGSNRG